MADGSTIDVAIIGGGINGASIYHHLCEQGHRVIILDKGDFASGTSQASAMWVWGGLLYLEKLDLPTVWKMCADRDRMLADMPQNIAMRRFRFCISKGDGRSAAKMQLGLMTYRLFSALRRGSARGALRTASPIPRSLRNRRRRPRERSLESPSMCTPRGGIGRASSRGLASCLSL